MAGRMASASGTTASHDSRRMEIRRFKPERHADVLHEKGRRRSEGMPEKRTPVTWAELAGRREIYPSEKVDVMRCSACYDAHIVWRREGE